MRLCARHISVATCKVPGLMPSIAEPLGVDIRGKGVSAHGCFVILNCGMM